MLQLLSIIEWCLCALFWAMCAGSIVFLFCVFVWSRRRHRKAMRRNEEAREKSLDLIKARLSPAQLKQFERHRSFKVTGSRGGRYLIEEGSMFNVAALGRPGRFCFVPKGASAFGDVMLAQKIMLESDEGRVLKIANKEPAHRTLTLAALREEMDRRARFDSAT